MYVGIDIGGTKCAVVKGVPLEDGRISVTDKISFPTESCERTLDKIVGAVAEMAPFKSIGISSGGPLDEERGIILSPPNLPGWDRIPISDILRERFSVPVVLRNDANACALAEWRFGAGRGTKNMIFMTFGTGLGAGLIIDGKLYSGTNGMAGEVGHVRLDSDGPLGYGKVGSFEGFCSGGGIARLAIKRAREALLGGKLIFSLKSEDEIDNLTAKKISELAYSGDPDAIEVFNESARRLGMGVSILIDVLNPERIVIGSVYARSKSLFEKEMTRVIEEEALAESASVCKIVPAELGDSIGDIAAIAVAMEV